MSDTVVRQQLELRKSAADQASREAQERIDAALAAQKFVQDVAAAERELQDQQAKAASALESASEAAAKQKAVDDELRRCDLLERALEVHAADKQTKEAHVAVDNEAALRDRLKAATGDRSGLAGQRAALKVPVPGALGPMRKLATELAAARGALDVGFVVTVTPNRQLDLRVRKDGAAADSRSTAQPLEIEANSEVEVSIADIATVRVRGGRRVAQEKATGLEDRWSREVEPHLVAAAVKDLESLDVKVSDVQALDAAIKLKDAEVESLGVQIAALADAGESLREAFAGRRPAEPCLETCHWKHWRLILRLLGPMHQQGYEGGDSSCRSRPRRSV